MPFQIELETRARVEFLGLPKDVAKELIDIFNDMKTEPRPLGARKLNGVDGFRIRRGSFRILYAVDEEKRLVRIYKVSRRREVYSKIREQLYKIRTGGPPPASGVPIPGL